MTRAWQQKTPGVYAFRKNFSNLIFSAHNSAREVTLIVFVYQIVVCL